MSTKRKRSDGTSPADGSGDCGRDKLAGDKNDRVDDSNIVAIIILQQTKVKTYLRRLEVPRLRPVAM